ncbi:MAG: hypothetical protein KVP17_003317 [Porospora cf. gigantea B]|uniref:uncharacterized protein n=1 Tax=Porospora cf. gigantea B TaxID=2853592 RepID=UPI003571BE83|nr:MAG: hypothetical protein KVP17_003317 [Porospora cf. gigantea B]
MDTPITAVWRSNLDAEFKRLKCLTESNPVIAVSTDFPGMVTRPLDALEDYNYQSLRGNLNLVNPVQLSLAPMQRGSNRPVGVWVFNMYFSLGEDVFNQAWVERLVPKVRFEEHSVAGIKLGDLGDRLVTSEILSGPDSLLISYNLPHDLGFIIKAILGTPLPKTEADFITAAKSFVPRYVDLKCVTSSVMHVVPENLLAAAQILRLPSTNEHVTAVTASLYARLVELLGTEPEVNHKIHNLGPLPIRPLSKSLLVPPSPPPFGPPAMPGHYRHLQHDQQTTHLWPDGMRRGTCKALEYCELLWEEAEG